MAWLFKLSGLLIVFTAAALTGFLKSLQLKKRYRKLCGIYRSLSDLRERVRLGTGEIERIVAQSFEDGTAFYTNRGIQINPDFLEKEDAALLEEYFSDIGMSDAESECERTGLYMNLLKKKCDEAEKKCGELCRLYNALGILCGIFICIFFL